MGSDTSVTSVTWMGSDTSVRWMVSDTSVMDGE